MPNEIEEYQIAMKAHDQAIRLCEHYADKIQQANSILKSWPKAMVENVGTGIPLEILRDEKAAINPQGWPTMQELGSALAAYHTTMTAAQAAYKYIPGAQRDVVKSPPK